MIFAKNAPQTLIIVKEEKSHAKTIQNLGNIENWTNSQNFDIQR
jgi:hypothetical protein